VATATPIPKARMNAPTRILVHIGASLLSARLVVCSPRFEFNVATAGEKAVRRQ
jgi:hypothetical protein